MRRWSHPVRHLRLLWAEHFTRDGLVKALACAAVAGFAGAIATMAFRAGIEALVRLATGDANTLVGSSVDAVVAAARGLDPARRLAYPAIGGLVAGLVLWLARRIAKRDVRGGDYMESIVIGDGRVPLVGSLVRSLSSLCSIASGGSIGREGPMVQLAAAFSSALARIGRLAEPQRRLVVACGAAAGITSAYNAPIAGSLFVAEIVLGSIAIESLAPLLIAALVANLTTHALAPDVPLYPIGALPTGAVAQYAAYAMLGLVAGFAAPLFLGLLARARAFAARVPIPVALKMALGGLVVGAISLRLPEVWGNGYSTINAILEGRWLGEALLALLLCKLVATAATVGSGAIGGIFTPTLFVGAALGALVTQALAVAVPSIAPAAAAGTAVAMGAFLSATTHAPLTAILMVLEMTAVWTLTLPLMLACVVAYVTVRVIRVPSVYAASEQRRRRDAELRDLSSRSIEALVRPSPPTIAVDASWDTVVERFAAERFQYLYLVDPTGLYRGAISLHDLRQAIAAGDADRATRTAATLVTPTLETVLDTATLEEALGAFARHRGERLPVVDRAGRLVGAAWKTDLLMELQQRLADQR